MGSNRQLSEEQQASLDGFARALRELREAAGTPSTAELAETIGYSVETVQVLFSGKHPTSRRPVEAVADALGVDPREWGARWQALGLEPVRARNTQCAIEGCLNKPYGKMCATHKLHKQLYGDPTAGRFSPKTHPAGCSVEGCERLYRAKGLCHRHYQQSLRLPRS